MKNLRRFFSLLAVLAFLAIPVFAQSASEPSADEGKKTGGEASAAFSEPLYCAGSGENIDITFLASEELLKCLTLDIYGFDISSALSKNLPTN